MDWYPSVINFTLDEYDEWLEQFGCWSGTAEHFIHIMTFKALNDATQKFLLHYRLSSTEEPMESNRCLDPLCGGLYPFIKPLPVRDKQSE